MPRLPVTRLSTPLSISSKCWDPVQSLHLSMHLLARKYNLSFSVLEIILKILLFKAILHY